MNFVLNEGLAPMAVEKIKILGAVLELRAILHFQFSPIGPFSWQMEWIGSAPSPLIFGHDNLFPGCVTNKELKLAYKT